MIEILEITDHDTTNLISFYNILAQERKGSCFFYLQKLFKNTKYKASQVLPMTTSQDTEHVLYKIMLEWPKHE